MDTAAGQAFRQCCRCMAGLTGPGTSSLLCSLPSELCFNDLRDAGRRHAKSEKTNPHNLHAVAHKSTLKRPAGAEVLNLTAQDWQQPLSQKHIKARVHSALKATDTELGICSEGLTKHRTNKNYTKPHILVQRLSLMKVLSTCYHVHIRPELDRQDDRKEVLLSVFSSMWTSKLVPEHCFISCRAHQPTDDTRSLVLSSRPYAARLWPLKRFAENVFTFEALEVPRTDTIVGDLHEVHVALTEECLAHDQLAWKQVSGWMSLASYVAEYSILSVPRSLLSSICSSLGLKHGKLDYKSRVKLFLEHEKKSEKYISEILEELPDKEADKAAESYML